MDERKIILMSKLAIQEKQYLKKDQKITGYYLKDYVYINNFKTRCLIILLTSIVCMGHLFMRIQEGLTFPTTPQEIWIQYMIPYGGIIILVVAVYTLLSTWVYKKQYIQADKRMEHYRQTLQELETYEIEKSKRGNDICN